MIIDYLVTCSLMVLFNKLLDIVKAVCNGCAFLHISWGCQHSSTFLVIAFGSLCSYCLFFIKKKTLKHGKAHFPYFLFSWHNSCLSPLFDKAYLLGYGHWKVYFDSHISCITCINCKRYAHFVKSGWMSYIFF